MSHSPNDDAVSAGMEREAAAWVLRRDRGLTAAEQDEFLQWLAADPRHGACFSHHRRSWDRLDRLSQWRPEHSLRPNPDLLAPPPRRVSWMFPLALAAAAAVAVALYVRWPRATDTREDTPLAVSVAPIEERLLADGSRITLNQSAAVAVDFTPGERLVRLVSGEAHFEVAKNPSRPFIVDAGGVRVRAVGTAFDVRLNSAAVAVLVTEGRVQVNGPAHVPPAAGRGQGASENVAAVPILEAGQRAVVSLSPAGPPPQVAALSPVEMNRLLAWQPRLLDFTATPLSEIVAEFNRHNRVQIRIAGPDLAALRISASFRSDNIAGFVRLLEASFGARAERRGADEIVVAKSR